MKAVAVTDVAALPDPPYPADTKAKGLRWRVDYERLNQSTTWAKAPAELKPWLLMSWYVAWQQIPCGSFEGDQQVIAAKIGMPWVMWQHHQEVMLRGWYRCSDGRFYHPVIAEDVLKMTKWRHAERQERYIVRAIAKRNERA